MMPGCLELFASMCLCHFVPEIVMRYKNPFRGNSKPGTQDPDLCMKLDVHYSPFLVQYYICLKSFCTPDLNSLLFIFPLEVLGRSVRKSIEVGFL